MENGKKSASKQLFSLNHVDFDFNRYSLISSSFLKYSNVKKWIFWIWEKFKIRKKLPHGTVFCFSFFQSQNVYFFTFEYIQKVTYRSFTLTFEQLWNFARETVAPLWSLGEFFILANLVMKLLQKIWSKNILKRRPRGSSIENGEFWPAKFGQMCLPQIFQVCLLHFVSIVRFVFSLFTSMKWLWNKVISTSIQ